MSYFGRDTPSPIGVMAFLLYKITHFVREKLLLLKKSGLKKKRKHCSKERCEMVRGEGEK